MHDVLRRGAVVAAGGLLVAEQPAREGMGGGSFGGHVTV